MKITFFGFDFFANCLSRILAGGFEVDRVYCWRGDGLYNHCDEIVRISEVHRLDVRFCRIDTDHAKVLWADRDSVLVVAGYPWKVPVFDGSGRGFNVHPSMLPHGKGQWPLPLIIEKHREHAGVTLHRLRNQMDAGEILLQRAIKLQADECLESLSSKCRVIAGDLVIECLDGLKTGTLWEEARQQEGGSYWPMPTDSDWVIDWRMPLDEILARIRAFGKCESVGVIEGKNYAISAAVGWLQEHSFHPGTLVHKSSREVLVAIHGGFVCLTGFRVI